MFHQKVNGRLVYLVGRELLIWEVSLEDLARLVRQLKPPLIQTSYYQIHEFIRVVYSAGSETKANQAELDQPKWSH